MLISKFVRGALNFYLVAMVSGFSEFRREKINVMGERGLVEPACGPEQAFDSNLGCIACVFARYSIQCEFHAAGNTDLVIDVAQVVANRVLRDLQF